MDRYSDTEAGCIYIHVCACMHACILHEHVCVHAYIYVHTCAYTYKHYKHTRTNIIGNINTSYTHIFDCIMYVYICIYCTFTRIFMYVY